MRAQMHLIMKPRQHQSGSYLEEFHDLRFCHPPWIKPFITCWHSCPVLNACTPWDSDEASKTWWETDNRRLCKSWPTAWRNAREAGRALPAMPTASPGSSRRLGTAVAPRPFSPEAVDSRHKRNRAQHTGPLTLAGPFKHCVLVTCHLLLFSWSDNTLRQGFSVFCETHKRKGEEKLTRSLFAPAQIVWKCRHQEKKQIKRQTKGEQPEPTKTYLAPLQLPSLQPSKTLWACGRS